MRFISPHSNYAIQVREPVERVLAHGEHVSRVIDSKPIVADFQQGGLMPHEVEVALETFNFSGLPEGVNPVTRLSFYDTEGAFPNDPETREMVEQRMLELARDREQAFIPVEHPLAPRPWASYDEQTVEEILETMRTTGTDPNVVARYEAENRNRSTLLEALSEAAPKQPVEVPA
jgi:hypothetical protein